MSLSQICSRLFAPALLLAALFVTPLRAQTFQFLPEVDAYYKFHPDMRFQFQAKETREAGDPTEVEIGPSFEYFFKPLIHLKDVTAFDLDDATSRPLVFSIGYRYVPSPDKPTTQRMEVVATPHYPLVAKFWLTDRNRFDLDWSNGQFTWRYRNRLSIQRSIAIGSYHPTPYASVEPFYESQYHKWATTAVYAGCLFPIHKLLQLDSYYEHQNVTSKAPNRQYNQFGLVLNMYFTSASAR
jgi:Protein of unknown function (DUF2490)